MHFIASLLASRSTQYFRRIAAAFVGSGMVALTIAAPRPAAAQVLTGISLFSTTATGQVSGSGGSIDVWDTVGGDANYNLWVSLAGTPINGPLDASAGISQILAAPGTYNFTIFANPGFNQANHGMNLFFGGNATNPSISVYAPTASATTETPAFFANSQTTLNLAGDNSTQGAGTLSFSTGGNKVTLTNYRWEYSTVQNQDVVGSFNRAAGGGADNQGSFTLVVTTDTPEPSALVLALTSSVPVAGLALRRRALARNA